MPPSSHYTSVKSRVAGDIMNYRNEPSDLLSRFRGVLRRSSARRAIASLLLQGCTRKQIALKMARSQHTIDAHLKAIYREVGVGDRARLMLLAMTLQECGELPPPELGNCSTGHDAE